MRFSVAAAAATVLAVGANADKNWLGFNSGSTKADRSAKVKKDFEAEFKTAQNLKNAPGDFNAVRLYTNIQAGSESDPIEAFDAAIDTETHILLGVWASGTDNIDKELTALKAGVKKYGKDLTKLIIGISIGSEDLYRDSATGVKNEAGIGNSPDAILGFIDDFKKSFKDTGLSDVPVGHVDTWDAWTNGTNKKVIDAVDWIGVDEYPYYETGKGNDIKNAGKLFDKAYEATIAVADGKPVWVTETGWPATGPDWDEAEPSVKNAKYYWNEIGCRQLFGKTPTFWYNLRDSNPDNEMKFAITENLSTDPLFDLSCPDHFDTDDQDKDDDKDDKDDKSSKTASPSKTSSSSHSTTFASASTSKTSSSDSDSDVSDNSASKDETKDDSKDDSKDDNPDKDSGAGMLKATSVATVASLGLIAGIFTLF